MSNFWKLLVFEVENAFGSTILNGSIYIDTCCLLLH